MEVLLNLWPVVYIVLELGWICCIGAGFSHFGALGEIRIW